MFLQIENWKKDTQNAVLVGNLGLSQMLILAFTGDLLNESFDKNLLQRPKLVSYLVTS